MDPTVPDRNGEGLAQLTAAGVEVWIDGISRAALTGRRLASLIARSGIVGVTTSPESFADALADGTAYAADLDRLRRTGARADAVALNLIADDVRAACDALADVHATTDGRAGWVSAPLDPRIATDPDATLAAARKVSELVDRPNLLVAIPATKQGVFATLAAVAEGISVEATHVFSLDRFRAVQAAYVEGLERAEFAGLELPRIASFVSMPMATLDLAVDAILDQVGTDAAAALRGRFAIASAVLAYQAFEARLTLPRWRDLAANGARPQRPIWAWTQVEDPAYRRTRYVDELVAPGVVAAVNEATLASVEQDAEIHGDTIHTVYAAAQSVIDDAERLGLVYLKVTAELEDEALDASRQAWQEVLAHVSRDGT